MSENIAKQAFALANTVTTLENERDNLKSALRAAKITVEAVQDEDMSRDELVRRLSCVFDLLDAVIAQ